uniref:PXMP2/4 family protein 4 n=2 Tax=Cajanus cajan TaxID=3821 RepID=A0A151SX44_CAJCA|nr:PXMP2/4 family protein 4 [Cajanus cajan]
MARPPPPHFRRLTKTHRPPTPPMPVVSFSSSSSSSPSPSRKSGFVAWYLRMLQSHPLATKSVTSSIIFAAADVTSQIITLPSFSASYNILRTFRMAAYGLLILGPSQHNWFNYLSKILPNTDVTSTLKKILMGQVIFGPVINTVFFTYNGALQGESGPEIITRLKRDLLPTLLGGALFWPVCDFVTFRFLPVHLQPLLNSSCAYVWTIYLTYMANRG